MLNLTNTYYSAEEIMHFMGGDKANAEKIIAALKPAEKSIGLHSPENQIYKYMFLYFYLYVLDEKNI